jgi:hypothetical protein
MRCFKDEEDGARQLSWAQVAKIMSQLREQRVVKKERDGGEGGAGVEAFGCQLHRFVIGEAGPEVTGGADEIKHVTRS